MRTNRPVPLTSMDTCSVHFTHRENAITFQYLNERREEGRSGNSLGNSRDYIVPFSVRGGNGPIVTNYFAVRKYSFLGNQEEEVTREANVERKLPVEGSSLSRLP